MHAAFWLGLNGLCTSALHNVFMLFHLELFVSAYGLDDGWFYGGHAVYMAWNAVNDPLFGWFSSPATRLAFIRHGAVPLALSFLVPWWPWPAGATGLHFVFSLCLYDTLFTLVVLNQCALFADLGVDVAGQAQRVRYAALLALASAVPVFLARMLWDPRPRGDRRAFCAFCVGLAMAACAGLRWTARALERYESRERHESRRPAASSTESVWAVLRAVFSQRSFVVFVAVNLVQCANGAFNTCFFTMFATLFLTAARPHSDAVAGAIVSSTSAALSYVLPGLITALLTHWVARRGVHAVLRTMLAAKTAAALACAVCVAAAPRPAPAAAAALVYAVVSRAEAAGTAGLFGIPLADVADEDRALRGRGPGESQSGMVYGLNALIATPGYSIGPMIGWRLLRQHVVEDGDGTHLAPASAVHVALIAAGVPLVCGVLQSLLWRRYTLHGRYLKRIKETLRRADGHVAGLVSV